MPISHCLIIAGSVRAQRLGITISHWVSAIANDILGQSLEVVDLRDWPLPTDDEPGMPQGGQYECKHARLEPKDCRGTCIDICNSAIQRRLSGCFEKCNRSSLRRMGRQAMLLAYVGRGGSHRAEQLDQVCRFVKMAPLATKPALTLTHAQVKAKSGEIDPPVAFADQMVDLKQALGELQDTLDASDPT